MRVLMGAGPEHLMETLNPVFQEARQNLIDAMAVTGKMDPEDVESIDTMVWIEAQSLKEYQDLDIYLARFKEVVKNASEYVE
jgi:uncharacterized membrane protein YdfJ with MMPL/SSD domain